MFNFKTLVTVTTAGKLDVIGHDGHTLGVNCAQVGIFENTFHILLAGFLQGQKRAAVETNISLEILSELTDRRNGKLWIQSSVLFW